MNQGIAFARTLRALDADDFRASKFGLLAAVILLVAWTWWMFTARVPQYETTTNVQIDSGLVMAYFPAEAFNRIAPGQSAIVHFNGSSFPARVQTVVSGRAELLFISQPPAPNPTPASADVEVSASSPASIALRILGHARPVHR